MSDTATEAQVHANSRRTPDLEFVMPIAPTNPLRDPGSWYTTASALTTAAKTLWERVQDGFPREHQPYTRRALRQFIAHGPPFLLLCAFAVENALKGTKVRQVLARGSVPTFLSKPRVRADNVWGHNLPELAREVGLQTDRFDDETLHVLMRNIEWAGRYPAAAEKGQAFVPRWGSDDMRYIVRLIRRIRRL